MRAIARWAILTTHRRFIFFMFYVHVLRFSSSCLRQPFFMMPLAEIDMFLPMTNLTLQTTEFGLDRVGVLKVFFNVKHKRQYRAKAGKTSRVETR